MRAGESEAIRARSVVREWIYGRQIDLTWWGVRNPGDVGVEPRPMGPIRRARCDELDRVLRDLDEMDRREAATAKPPACTHADDYGSTVIFVQDRPQDGVCMLCDAKFPALRVLPKLATEDT